MFKTLAMIIALWLLLTTGAANGYNLAPEDGLWWNPLESGRGWTFETQNDITVVTHYTYRADGSSTFFTTSGAWDDVNGVLVGSVFSASGGQCVGCPYSAPTNQSLGIIRFEFTSRISGRAVYPNGTIIPIQKYQFVYADPKTYLKGMWATTWVMHGGGSFSHFIRFNANCSTCGTANSYSVIGDITVTESAGRVAVGQLIPNSGNRFLVLVDAEPDYWDFYYVAAEKDGWRGFACTRLKTEPFPTGVEDCTGVMFGLRALPPAGLRPPAVIASNAKSTSNIASARATTSREKVQATPLEWSGVQEASWQTLIEEVQLRSH